MFFFFDLQNWIWRTPVSAKCTHQPRVRQQPIETIIPIPGIRFYSDKNPPAHGTTNQKSETWDKGDTHEVCRGFIFPTDFSGNSSWDILALHVRSEMSLLGMLTIRFRANPQSPKNFSGLYQRTFAKAMTHRCLPTRRYNDWLNGCEVHPLLHLSVLGTGDEEILSTATRLPLVTQTKQTQTTCSAPSLKMWNYLVLRCAISRKERNFQQTSGWNRPFVSLFVVRSLRFWTHNLRVFVHDLVLLQSPFVFVQKNGSPYSKSIMFSTQPSCFPQNCTRG